MNSIKSSRLSRSRTRLNGICPYFTMFPLEFPYSVLRETAPKKDWVIDPFCGRGTTMYAARLIGMPSIGIDSSPVAVAISESKLANTTVGEIVQEANDILSDYSQEPDVPTGEFWSLAYDGKVLMDLAILRRALMTDCRSDSRKALRAILLGALHGPRNKVRQTYFSNQCQRTYAPKPKYAVKYWKRNGLKPEPVDVVEIIAIRAEWYFSGETNFGKGYILAGDARDTSTYEDVSRCVKYVITSPPYYGMHTYLPDQWLRLWFLGGEASVQYRPTNQISHNSQHDYICDLRKVWASVGEKCVGSATMVIRLGSIGSRKADPLELAEESLAETEWSIEHIKPAGNPSLGRRQATHINTRSLNTAREELDIWATWSG